jgi:hypothetical protein
MASIFSGKAGRNASIETAKWAGVQLHQLEDIYGTGRTGADKQLKGGYDKSLKNLKDYYGASRTDVTGGRDAANAAITGGRDAGLAALQGGYSDALSSVGKYYGQGADTLNQAAAGFDPLIQRGMQGYDMYNNSLGLNGAEGRDAARGAFQAGPGYQWNVDQALDQSARAANKMGSAYGGNANDATTRLASNLANQEYGNWQNRLQGFQGAAQNAVSGQAGVLTNLANLYQNEGNTTSQLNVGQGKDTASLYANAASGVANNDMAAGTALSGLASNQGSNLASLNTNYSQSQANNTLNYANNMAGAFNNFYQTTIPSMQQGMMAGQQAAGNRMGAIMGGVQLAGQALGGFMGLPTAGGGSIGGSIFSKLWPG